MTDAQRETSSTDDQRGYFPTAARFVRPVWSDSPDDDEQLRRTQVGAAFALTGHFTVADEPGQVVMPTGSGKTAVMTLVPYLVPTRRLLVVAPSQLVRDQVAEEFKSLNRLRTTGTAPAKTSEMPGPRVKVVKKRIGQPDAWEELREYDVVVGTPMCLSAGVEGVTDSPSDLFDLVLLDEAHHTPARTWETILEQFPEARAGLFTATPFRRDLKMLPGSICYFYSLHDAIADGVFEPVTLLSVSASPDENRDLRLAQEAAARLADPTHQDAGSLLLVRASSVAAARRLVDVYASVGVEIGVIDSHKTLRYTKRTLKRLSDGELRGVATVGMLGEGFDLPALKIAAYHDRHRSLPATLQFIGRVARRGPPAPAELLAVREEVQDETRALYSEDASWAELLPAIADAAVEEERQRRVYLRGFETPPPATFSLHAVAPMLQAEILELDEGQAAPDLGARMDRLGGSEVWWSGTDEAGELRALVTQRRVRPAWMRADSLDTVEHELHLVAHVPQRRLLFVSTSSPATRRDLLAAIGARHAAPVDPQRINRLLHGLQLLAYSSVGLRSARISGGTLPTYKTVAGSDAQRTVLPVESQSFGVGHLIGRYRADSGLLRGIGVSTSSGKVWEPASDTLLAYRDWCVRIAQLLHSGREISAAAPLLDVTMPRRLTNFPAHAVTAALDHRLFEGNLALRTDDTLVELWSIQLELDRRSERECLLTLSHDGRPLASVRLLPGGRVQAADGSTTLLDRQTGELLDLADILDTYSPMLYFSDGSSVVRGTLFVPRSDLPPLPDGTLSSIDWRGVDLRAEVRIRDRALETVQGRAIEWIAATSPDSFIIRDDGAGEIADLIQVEALGEDEVRLALLHCKYSSAEQPGHRLADLYEVVGQAVRSAQWTAAGVIWPELARRLRNRKATQVVAGEESQLLQHLERWTAQPPAVESMVVIIQPGLRILGVEDHRGCHTLLSACHNWITSLGASFRCIGSA